MKLTLAIAILTAWGLIFSGTGGLISLAVGAVIGNLMRRS